MINTYHSSLPPPPLPPRHGLPQRAPGRASPPVWCLSILLVLQMALTFGGFVYLFRKNASMQNEFLDKNYDDFIVLKRLQECNDGGSLDSNSLLDCKQIVDKYMAVMSKVKQAGGPETGARLSGWIPFRDSSAVAHMVAERLPESKSQILKWRSDHSLRAGVTYLSRTGSLKIIKPGNYYVYSQVTFSKRHPKAPLQQCIVCRSTTSGKTLEKILLRAYATLESENSQLTSFQGGVFSLEKDEELFVTVTDMDLITFEEASTTFGLFML